MSSLAERTTAALSFLSSPCFSSLFPPPAGLQSLSDGVSLFKIMSDVDPAHFSAASLTLNAGDNWPLKLSNLKKLSKNLQEYYDQALYLSAPGLSDIDVTAVAKDSSPGPLLTLFGYVVAALISCDKKADYITAIMGMDPEEQGVMKGVIEEAMNGVSKREEGRRSSLDVDGEEVFFDEVEIEGLSAVMKERDAAREERDGLKIQLAEVQAELSEALMGAQSGQVEEVEKHNEKLQGLLTDLQGRLDTVEGDLERATEDLAMTSAKLESKTEELSSAKKSNTEMLDEVDILKSASQRLARAEATAESYKGRLEEMTSQIRQVKLLEEQSAKYLADNIKLEAKLKESSALKAAADASKKKSAESDKLRVEAEARLKVKMEEVTRLKGDVDAAKSKAKLYEDELELLKASRSASVVDSAKFGVDDADAISSKATMELKEKVARLEAENQGLKDEKECWSKEKDERDKSLESMREAVQREAVQKTEQLMAEVVKLQEEVEEERKGYAVQLAQKDSEVVKVKAEADARHERMKEEVEGKEVEIAEVKARSNVKRRSEEKLEEEVATLRKDRERLIGDVNKAQEETVRRKEAFERERKVFSDEKESLAAAVKKLTEAVKAKDAKVEEALKEKAKIQNYTSSVLSKFQDKYLVALTQCKRKLKDEKARAEALEAKLGQDRAQNKREEKLLSSSIYELGMFMLQEQQVQQQQQWK